MTTKTRKRKPGAGRPASPFPDRYQLRHTGDQLAAWMSAAGVDEPGPALQAWIRKTLDREATRDAKR